ncbi:MAG TPA: hypothetical protein VKU02_21710 [Gemmataceae bacterium]|nr:hypothetical protein [Gemmataceae bacterium]
MAVMQDPKTQARLQAILRRESRSLLQYVRDSFPWTRPEEKEALAQLQTLIGEEQPAITAFAKFLVRNRIPVPHLGSYPVDFTTLNFVSLDHLLPMLVDAEDRCIRDLENDVITLTDPDSRAEIQKLLDMKRQHRKTLEALTTAHPESVVHP